jgi:hypothetical protein
MAMVNGHSGGIEWGKGNGWNVDENKCGKR